MMTLEEFNAAQRENQADAAAHAAAILACPEDLRQVQEHLTGYVGCKYFLLPREMESENLIELGNAGTEKLANLRKGGLDFADKSVGCTSVASSVTKKALLVLSLGKALGLRFDPDEIAETTDIPGLALLIHRMLTGGTP